MKRTNSRRSRSGQTLVFVIIGLLGTLGIAALCIDYAFLTVAKDQLRAAADSAALAAAAEFDGGNVVQTAVEFAAKNDVASDPLIIDPYNVATGVYDFDTGEFDSQTDFALHNAVRVTASRSKTSTAGALPTFFASVLGIGSADVTVRSAAAVDRRVSGIAPVGSSPLVPFLVDVDTFGGLSGNIFEAPIGGYVEFYPERNDAPGNFGLANLDGGSTDVPELVEFITFGFPGVIEIPAGADYILVEGTPGFKEGIKNAVQARIGDTIVVLVYDNVAEAGSNAIFRVRTFCAIEVTDAKLAGQRNSYIGGIVRTLQSAAVRTSPGGVINSSLSTVRLVQ